MNLSEQYVYKKEVDWSLLQEGITLPVDNQVVFGRIMDRFLKPGESKKITLILNGKSYDAQIRNVAFSEKWRGTHKKDILQIRYTKNGDLSSALKAEFYDSYSFIKSARDARASGDRSMIKVPEGKKEYMVIYTSEYDDTYILDSIRESDNQSIRKTFEGYSEQDAENYLNFNKTDPKAHIDTDTRLVKIRRLDRSICDNLKLRYSYRCQICGKVIGEEYGQHIAEGHHIDYFVKSLNNDASNMIILCPNHHRIIHGANPRFDRKKLVYEYDNGYSELLRLNYHL